MLRAQAWQASTMPSLFHSTLTILQRSPYVCTSCRQGRSATQSHARIRIATNDRSAKSGTIPRGDTFHSQRQFTTSCCRSADSKPKFPGGFAGGAGKFGAFAAKAKPVTTSGLLPHELVARKQTAVETAHAPAPQSKPRPLRPTDPARDQRTLKSKTILADIFRSDRQPRDPAAPNSSTSGSDRKSQQSEAGQKPGEANIWQELTKAKYNGAAKQDKGALQRKKGAKSALKQNADEFWDNLDGKEKSAAPKAPKNKQGKSAGVHTHPSHVGDELPLHRQRGTNAPPPEQSRKSTRFDDEIAPRDSKKSKKAKRQQKTQSQRDDDWEDDADRWDVLQERRKAKEERKLLKAAEPEMVPIFLPEYISASDLALALKQRVESFLSDMGEMGFENITSDTIMTGETAALVAMEYGFEPTVDNGSERDIRPAPIPEDVSSLPSRPPVVTIMGHVDHGKTTLLDYLRKSSVAAGEHGGITQHIGAFIVQMSTGKQITFLDTPGHAAFLTMRQRGANVTDIVVLVVAADDSVKPQTIEALKHAKEAKVPIIVAINKVDKEDARIDQVKADLSRHGVEIEDYGGDVQVVCVSGKTGHGMAELEENIITLSEILDVRAETDGMADGWLLESSVKQDGRAATVLVKRGALRQGDYVVAGKTWARIRLLRNEAGVDIAEAPPGTPVEILGWRDLPAAGEMVLQAADEAAAKMAVEYRIEMAEREQNSVYIAAQEQRQREKAAADALAAEMAELGQDGEDVASDPTILTQSFIVKADVAGSVEAVNGSILEQGNHEVRSKVLRSLAGQVTEYDVDLAAASGSIIINFNTTVPPHIKQRAEDSKVRIMDHTVIYHVVDDVRAALGDLLPPLETLRVHGEADILQIFPINITKRVVRNIAGCRIRNGTLKKGSKVKLLRKGKVIYDGKFGVPAFAYHTGG